MIVTQVGERFPSSICEKGFNNLGFIYCEGTSHFMMNKDDLRFQIVYRAGYVGASATYRLLNRDKKDNLLEEGSDTPSIAIGKCSPL